MYTGLIGLDKMIEDIQRVNRFPKYKEPNFTFFTEGEQYYSRKFTLPGYEKDEVQVQISDKELIVKTTDDVHDYKYDIKGLGIEKGVKNHVKKMKGGILEIKLKKRKDSELQEIK